MALLSSRTADVSVVVGFVAHAGTSWLPTSRSISWRDPRIENWPYRWVRWRDFRLPDSTEDALAALRHAHTRAEFERIEIACDGGIGRTGSALSILAVMSGVDADNAVAWVRAHYHPRSVETVRQRQWIEDVSALLSN